MRLLSKFAGLLSLLAAFVAAAMVLGLLAAGLFLPAVGATGSMARSSVDLFDALPSEFTETKPYQQSRILASDGKLIATLYDENRIIVPLSKIAKIMRQAQVAIEDSRFYEHAGVDVRGTTRALASNLRGGQTQGGSTLTQQFVKLTLQDKALQAGDKVAAAEVVDKNYMRKLQELKYAIQVEKQMSKDKILEGYLNLAYFGDRAYGVEAAARNYFSKSASKLRLTEAALLAGLVQNPSNSDPVNYPDVAIARRDVVLARMLDLGLISQNSHDAAKKTTLKQMLKPGRDQGSCANAVKREWAYFCDYVYRWLLEQRVLGKSVAARKDYINRGGLTIQTTFNTKYAKIARAELLKKVNPDNRYNIGAAAVTVEPGTGRVLSMAQSSSYALKTSRGKTSVNWAVDYKYGGSRGFAVGSTIKAFALVTALEQGRPIRSSITVRPQQNGGGLATFTSVDFPGKCGTNDIWKVKGGQVGRTYSLSDGTSNSVNGVFAELTAELGACKVRDTQIRMGVHRAVGGAPNTNPSDIVLGSTEASPVTMASVYATLAAEGLYCEPIPVLSITTTERKRLKLPAKKCDQVISKDVARGTTFLMKGTFSGTASGSGLPGRPAAGKTGSTDNSNETWFIGFTPQMSTAVWVGTPKNNRLAMNGITLKGRYYSSIFGGTVAAPVWNQIMTKMLAGQPVEYFKGPSYKVMNGVRTFIPDVSGLTPSEAVSVLRRAKFNPVITQEFSDTVAKGVVIGSNPSGSAPQFSTVRVLLSKGKDPKPPKPPKTDPPATDDDTPDNADNANNGGNGGNGPKPRRP